MRRFAAESKKKIHHRETEGREEKMKRFEI